ncbi:MAG TPA: hypothetical protein VF395_13655, partial [Polyangiaceae bacterium]
VPALAPALLVTAGASQIILRSFYFIDDQYTAESYLFYAMGLLVLFAFSRPFSMERLRAWREGRKEPKGHPFGVPRSPSAPSGPAPITGISS